MIMKNPSRIRKIIKLFDDASAWMKKSNNDHTVAAELFRKNNQTQERLVASAAETPGGWIP